MIELPECHVLSSQLNGTLTGKTVQSVTVGAFPHKFAWYSPEPERYNERLRGKTFTGSNPGTGYTCGGNTEICFGTTFLVISTPIRFHAAGEKRPDKHQLLVEFTDNSVLSCTVQMWGAMLCVDADGTGLPDNYQINNAPTPLEERFDAAYFAKLLSGVKKSLSAKAFLATEQRIPGLGNGVLQDILWNAKINPRTHLEALSDTELDILYHSVKSTLAAMAAQGGRDTERDLFGAPGGYRTILSAKNTEQICPVCNAFIKREAFLGGNIYYCPNCQPRK
jgi:Formamidopyrimidine-DNA glycosylase